MKNQDMFQLRTENKKLREEIAALKAKAAENEKVFLRANANSMDAMMLRESVICDLCAFMDARELWGDPFARRILRRAKPFIPPRD